MAHSFTAGRSFDVQQMARTFIARRFGTLLTRIQPLATEVAASYAHADSVKARLAACFELKKFYVVGSHARQSAIRSYSDVDYFMVLSRNEVRWGGSYVQSSTVLDRLREELSDRFWQTRISRDGQAIVMNFGNGVNAVDVVPGFFGEMGPKWPVYLIPDGSGWWMPTNPEVHSRYIREADQSAGGKLRRTVQLLKFWRECRQPRIPLSSIHLELVLANECCCIGPQTYSSCLTSAWQVLADRACRALRDPLQIAGTIPVAKTTAQQEYVLSSVLFARDHGIAALSAEDDGDSLEARRQWDIVFNGAFPQR
jgi:hypothetical protein